MRTKSDHLRVDIQEATDDEVRTFTIKLTAPLNNFELSDLLRQRHVIQPFNRHLKRTVKNATAAYLRAADALVAGLSPKPEGPSKANTYLIETDSVN
jgi:hypothetical protein